MNDQGHMFPGGGEMGERVRAQDWSRTSLGPIPAWSASLRSVVSICLGSRNPIAICWGRNYSLLYNDAYIAALGPKHPEALGAPVRETWGEIWDTIGPMLDGVMQTGQPTWSEDFPFTMHRHVPKEETYFTFSYSPIIDDDGDVGGVLCVCTETTADVVGRRRTRTLYELAELLQATDAEGACRTAADVLTRNAADVPFALFYLRDADGTTARLVAATGIEPGRRAAPKTVPLDQDGEGHAWPLASVSASGHAEIVDGLSRRFGVSANQDGAFAPPETAMALPLVRGPGEPPAGFLVLAFSPHRVRDRDYETFFELIAAHAGAAIASARAFEGRRELERTVALLDALFEAAPVGLSYLDTRFRHLHVNQTLGRMFGFDPRTAVGKSIWEILPQRSADWLATQLDRVVASGEPLLNVETHRDDPEGRRYWLENFYPVRPAGSNAQAIGAAILEITERKRHEEERERLLARTEAARAAAEEASRLKDEFLATVSHELRTPLNAIVGWARLLRSGRVTPDQSMRAVETIERNAKAQTQLIEDLLDVSRIISGKLRLDVQDIADLHYIVERAIDSIRPAAQAKEIRIAMILDPTAGALRGDPERLQQIVWNLVANAIKFTPKGGRVQVSLARKDSNIEIVVSDTGIGIAADFLPYVFDRFRQADARTTRTHGGLGLGLAISRHLVELHGGTISVESAGADAGTTFTVLLPMMSAGSARTTPFAVEETDAPLPNAQTLSGIRVLAVDDEPDTLEIMKAILEEFGAEVRIADSTRNALHELDAWRPDVLLSDIGMSGEDGYALIRKVRQRAPEDGGRVPAVALTAYARIQDRLKVLSSGFQMHIAKPVEPAELVTVVGSLVRRRD